MEVPDRELEQLYAARYRSDSLVANSPILRDSLENSSDGGNSLRSSFRSSCAHTKYLRASQSSNIGAKISHFGGPSRSPQTSQPFGGGLLQIATDRTSIPSVPVLENVSMSSHEIHPSPKRISDRASVSSNDAQRHQKRRSSSSHHSSRGNDVLNHGDKDLPKPSPRTPVGRRISEVASASPSSKITSSRKGSWAPRDGHLSPKSGSSQNAPHVISNIDRDRRSSISQGSRNVEFDKRSITSQMISSIDGRQLVESERHRKRDRDKKIIEDQNKRNSRAEGFSSDSSQHGRNPTANQDGHRFNEGERLSRRLSSPLQKSPSDIHRASPETSHIDNLNQQHKISRLFQDESCRTHSPVSSAIRNLLSYQQLQEENQKIPGLADFMIRKERESVQVPPPAPRRPTLLRVVTENQLLEGSVLTPTGVSPTTKLARHSNLTPTTDRSVAPSPPYFYGEHARDVQSSRSPGRPPIQPDPSVYMPCLSTTSPSQNNDYLSKNMIEAEKFETPSPRNRADLLHSELNNPAGLLAYVTRDSNSPHVERSVTGLIKNRSSQAGPLVQEIGGRGSSFHNNNSPLPERLHEAENMNPVRVLPSKLDSKGVSEMFRNFQRSSEIESSTRQRLLEEEESRQKRLLHGTELPKDIPKLGTSLVKSISRSISRRKNSLHRLRGHSSDVAIEPQISSFDQELSHSPFSSKDTPMIEDKSSSRIHYETFQNESDGTSSKSESPPESLVNDGLQSKDVSDNRISSESLEDVKTNRNQASPKDRIDPTESPGGKEKTKEPRNKFWTFTTSVVFPKPYPDHPERDSLDGNLPGSSHGTGNPPPPPAPPRPEPPLDSAKPQGGIDGGGNGAGSSGFIKGPNAGKSKKGGRKLKSDTDGSTMGEEDLRDNLSPLEKKHVSKKARDFNSGFLGVPGMRDRDFDGPGGYRSMKEPYMYLWTVMSGMYGKLVVLLMLAFCLTEVLENDVEPFTFQGIFLIYLYVGSIFAIICIYTSVIMENCPSISASKENLTKPGDPEVGSITSFGTLKRAHISRSKTSRTSFYLRVGALVFGLVTLIFNGLEIAMHSTMREDCAQDVMFAHPIMQALFTFLQMHFLFVNSEVVVEKFGQIARFAFMHLVATNLAIWVRMVVWESANDWIHATYANKNVFDIPWHAQKVLHLHSCYHNNTLGRLWTSSQEQFFPFLIEYSLIAAAVTYIMWRNVGKEHLRSLSQLSKNILEETMHEKRGRKGHWKVDCRSASKGLFLGLLVLVGGIVILIISFVMKDQDGFRDKMFWMVNGSQIVILTLSITSCLVGFWQIPKLAVSSTKPLELDRLLLSCTIVGAYIFAIFGMIVGGLYFHDQKMLTIFCTNGLLFLQVSLQGMLVAEASRRTCATRLQQLVKPGRQVITFLLFANVTLWILDSFITHSTLSQEFQAGFYGTLAWGIISRISLPLLILYRFHSAVILVEIWKNTYRTKAE